VRHDAQPRRSATFSAAGDGNDRAPCPIDAILRMFANAVRKKKRCNASRGIAP
jgi:hypothetical protein